MVKIYNVEERVRREEGDLEGLFKVYMEIKLGKRSEKLRRVYFKRIHSLNVCT